MRKLALEYAKSLIEDEIVLQHVHDALRLHDLCGVERRTVSAMTDPVSMIQRRNLEKTHSQEPYCEGVCIYVSPRKNYRDNSAPNGSIYRPWCSIHEAVDHARTVMASEDSFAPTIVLRHGVHSLQAKTLKLSEKDSGLSILGYPGERVWISGGLDIDEDYFEPTENGVYVANLTGLLANHQGSIPPVVSLFTTNRRYIRARYPNADPEVDQWGYASKNNRRYSISSEHVLEWHRMKPMAPPTSTFFDFSKNPPPGVPKKNNSAQEGYNWYASGHGGACSEIWGENANSYWCSNASQGGWAEVDAECAMAGQMQLPVGMSYNTSSVLERFQNISLIGGIIFAWHSQSWAMHMFEITNQSSFGELTFAKGGGRQGGRNWCRCDQCTYAGPWCGQNQNPPVEDKRMISGTWMVENVLGELDMPGEFYFDRQSNLLYVKPNATIDMSDFKIGLIEQLIEVRNASNIAIMNVGFRDVAPTFMSEWSAPSGGDWSLHRGGAIFLESASNISVSKCIFRRLDGNGIFLSRRTRNIDIKENVFEWLGENGIATWGDTDNYDATAENFPMYTTIQKNVFRELGIYQKQSSAVGQSKAALSTIRDNIMFNMPRAAINFNDMVGGGDTVEGNLIFNSCRESGDHGPINSWDRQAYLTTLRDGVTKSFDPIPRTIHHNFIFANYGASQAVDNDDGSSWFHIYKNVFYSAEGFKMDYGGHDSIYEDNLIMAYPYDGQQCYSMGGFSDGPSDVFRRNRCLIGLGNAMDSGCGDPSCASSAPDSEDSLAHIGSCPCEDQNLEIHSNEYYTQKGDAVVYCGNDDYSLEEFQEKFGLEVGSTKGTFPDEDTIVTWAKEMVIEM
eukprot:CAMPEP_0194218324 /NCGR_PEP_ID=MMETSP0156-20130528/23532_1 /TAXON_ID=33649 /ORGANISM="Thalassionema nitzschioides, Strain L26-B" /LENGTH=846 /DNA_ID=CAMNT_0038947637 /DNA_START=140 /DNA_END=2680 /DNA_ORIENTATION=+